MKNPVYLILLLFALAGCIEPYHAKTDSIDNILVVEGIITSGTTLITLSKSVGLEDNIYDNIFGVNNAAVYVECEDGTKSQIAYPSWNPYASYFSGWGNYLVETGELDTEKKYRLVIELDGEEYQSGYLAPVISPPVEVSFKLDQNDLINVCVSTTGFDQQPGYYLWSYKEDWEINAIMYNDTVMINGKLTFNDLYSADNRYYCWRKDSSRVLLLGTTERLIENTIREKAIWYFNRADNRFSVLYRINLFQNTIHKEGYDYFYNLQKNIEQTGSIFGTIPSEIMGNIKCVSNPEIPVIGYVDVSTTTSDEQYLNNMYYDPSGRSGQYRQCEAFFDTIVPPREPPKPGSGSVRFSQNFGMPPLPEDPVIYIPEYCVDCTKNGGSKRKPENWPNNHQ